MDLAGFANIVVPTPINSDSLKKGEKPKLKTQNIKRPNY